ncbi:hypothetical protein PsorP6_011610 [Peronosclerospora sorghi]|uniref:Uncharacterized protein n=1 Tax=Peronosclerospora sorghi TaxID=230839 RepID=A0ACC0WKC0_9STRA|nr:hypothetical protein PsorP6_011610 [Peronosclerospora sorghi]
MEITIRRRRSFCHKPRLHRIKTERSSFSRTDDEEQVRTLLDIPQAVPSIRLLHECAMTDHVEKQQLKIPIQTSYRRRPRSARSSTSFNSSSESSTEALRRMLRESEDKLSQAVARAEATKVDAAELGEINTRVAALSAASSLLRVSISSSILLGRHLDWEKENFEPEQEDLPIISRPAPAAVDRNAVANDFGSTKHRECQICFDELKALQTHVCTACSGSFCVSCTRWYVEYKVLEGEVSQKKMVCPAPQCLSPLSEELIQALIGIRFCPRAGCCAVLDEPLNSTARTAKCQACKKNSCMRCGGDFHMLPTCRRVEKRFGHWKKHHNVRTCPTCKAVIEKQVRPRVSLVMFVFMKNHDETLCIVLGFLRSKNRKNGCCAPLRIITKSAIVSIAAVAANAGAGIAVIFLPSVQGTDTQGAPTVVTSTHVRLISA